MFNEGQAPSMGLFETVKNAMQPESIAQRIGMDKNMLIDIGMYGAIGFILGFLIKKYSEYFIASVLLIIGMVVLQQFDYISVSINISKIHEMLGLESIPAVGYGYSSLLLDWMKANVAGAASLAVGFLVGIKVG